MIDDTGTDHIQVDVSNISVRTKKGQIYFISARSFKLSTV